MRKKNSSCWQSIDHYFKTPKTKESYLNYSKTIAKDVAWNDKMKNSIKVNIELPTTFMMSCNVNAYMRYTLKIDTILICFDTYALAFKLTVFILLFLLVTLWRSQHLEQKGKQWITTLTSIYRRADRCLRNSQHGQSTTKRRQKERKKASTRFLSYLIEKPTLQKPTPRCGGNKFRNISIQPTTEIWTKLSKME